MLRWNKLRKTSVLIISAFLNSCYTLMLAFIFSLVCCVYPLVLTTVLVTRITCVTVKSFWNCWSFPLFSLLLYLIQEWYCKVRSWKPVILRELKGLWWHFTASCTTQKGTFIDFAPKLYIIGILQPIRSCADFCSTTFNLLNKICGEQSL